MNAEQIKACSRSHSELEQYHYDAVRRSPAYRLECQLDELRLRQEPSNAEMYGTLEYSKEVLSYPKQEPEKKQWDAVQQLQSEVRGWRQKHAEMMLALEKLDRGKKYLYE